MNMPGLLTAMFVRKASVQRVQDIDSRLGYYWCVKNTYGWLKCTKAVEAALRHEYLALAIEQDVWIVTLTDEGVAFVKRFK